MPSEMMGELRGILPRIWHVEAWQSIQIEVFVEWLDAEIEQRAEDRLPILSELKGHRNREVYRFVQDNRDRYWGLAAEHLYGNMPFYSESWH